jgi:hypothetical protein
MYVQVGAALSPEALTDMGVSLERAASVAITKLHSIAAEPADSRGQLLREAIAAAASSTTQQPKPEFSFRVNGTGGRWKAEGASEDVTAWAPSARAELISTLGPLLDSARDVDRASSPREVRLLAETAAGHDRAVLELRAQHAAQLSAQAAQLATLALALQAAHGAEPRRPSRPLRWLAWQLRQVAARVRAPRFKY